MASMGQCRRWLATVRPPPGWRLEMTPCAPTWSTHEAVLKVILRVPDTYGRLGRDDVLHRRPAPVEQFRNRAEFLRFVWQVLVVVAVHEAAEWFVVDGNVRPEDPHVSADERRARWEAIATGPPGTVRQQDRGSPVTLDQLRQGHRLEPDVIGAGTGQAVQLDGTPP